MTRARVLSFHMDDDDRPGLVRALDGVAEMFATQSDFLGLVCWSKPVPATKSWS